MATYKIQKHNKKQKCHKDSPLKSQRPHTQTDHPAIKKYKITKQDLRVETAQLKNIQVMRAVKC